MLCKMCSCACAWRARTFAQRAGLFSGSGWYSSACSSASAAVLSAFGGFFELLLCGVLHAGSRYEQRVTRRAMPVLDDPRKSASHRPRRPASNPAAHFQTHLDGMATRPVYGPDRLSATNPIIQAPPHRQIVWSSTALPSMSR